MCLAKQKTVISQVRPPCVQRCISVLVVKSGSAHNSHLEPFQDSYRATEQLAQSSQTVFTVQLI